MLMENQIYPYDPQLAELPFRLTCIGGTNYQKHVNRPAGYIWHQILFCKSGYGKLKFGGSCTDIAPGTIIFLPRNVAHEYYPLEESWSVMWICFDGGYCDNTLKLFDMLSEPHAVLTTSPTEIEKIYEKIYAAISTDILFSAYTNSGLIYELVLAVKHLVFSKEERAKSKRLSKLIPALDYMKAHFNTDISITTLAAIIDVTPQHFCRLFKEALNMRPIDYLLNLRMNEAIKLLKENVSVSEAASRCGFNDSGYFSTTFKRYTGNTPSMYHHR